MPQERRKGEPFAVKDCALIAVATGKRAQNLKEMVDTLMTIHPGAIYHHFWGGLLRPRFDDPQYNNDFAVWCHYGLHDDILAERLAVIDPTDYENLEAIRQRLIEVLENRLDELETLSWSRTDQQFYFLRSQIVVFDTQKILSTPEELAQAIPHMSVGSVFFHFIDARRRFPWRMDDFRAWLQGFGEEYGHCVDALSCIDPYFLTLTELRTQIHQTLTNCLQRNA